LSPRSFHFTVGGKQLKLNTDPVETREETGSGKASPGEFIPSPPSTADRRPKNPQEEVVGTTAAAAQQLAHVSGRSQPFSTSAGSGRATTARESRAHAQPSKARSGEGGVATGSVTSPAGVLIRGHVDLPVSLTGFSKPLLRRLFGLPLFATAPNFPTRAGPAFSCVAPPLAAAPGPHTAIRHRARPVLVPRTTTTSLGSGDSWGGRAPSVGPTQLFPTDAYEFGGFRRGTQPGRPWSGAGCAKLFFFF
jgi:hypothetical protein